MDLSKLSNQEIETAIQKMQKGIEIKPSSPESAELQISIDRALEELQRRGQKKSQPQEEIEPANIYLPTLANMQECAREAQAEAVQQSESKVNKQSEPQIIRELSGNYQGESRVIASIMEAPVISVPVVQIALSSSTKQMNRNDIMSMLKTYFKRVATSKAMEAGRYSDAYGSSMGQDTYKLFQGWNVIYNETKEGAAWPPMADVFPGLARASQSQKVCAELLWRWASNDRYNEAR